MNLSIVIPVFNEEKTLLEILNRINHLKKYCNLEIIVVDDGSADKSREILQNNTELYSECIYLENNFGKGKAVIEGIKKCTFDYILVQDADLEYDPKDIIMFIDEIKKHNYNFSSKKTWR